MNSDTISCVSSRECLGCMACMHLCPSKAIVQTTNEKGFIIPQIDEDKCNSCGICHKYCPVINHRKTNITMKKETYAVMAKDDIRALSSSGGAFFVIAKFVLQKKGIVVGAAYDTPYYVIHSSVEKEEDLHFLQKSKYVQSDISRIYSVIREYIDKNKYVLFVGTPCQISAIKQVFGNRPNMLLIDILCMGVSSSDCLKKYLDEEFGNKDIEQIDFRYKRNDLWNQELTLRLIYRDGEELIPYEKSSYFLAFLKGISVRECCNNCQYAGQEREGDITIGDFWGIGTYNKNLDDGKGTSMVVINSQKGEEVYNEIKDDFIISERVPFEIACNGNVTLTKQLLRNSLNARFWKEYRNKTLTENISMLLDDTADYGIINYWYTNDHGAILTAYALQCLLKDNGYSSKLINLTPEDYDRKNGISEKFEMKYLDSTYEKISDSFMDKLNNNYKGFLVGSDQVFRAEWVPDNWFLKFADSTKIKIAISASFGTNTLNISSKREKEISKLLNRFNNISVREIDGIDICNKLKVKNVQCILDPVFLIDKKHYTSIAVHTQVDKKYCFCYIRDLSSDIEKQISEYATNNNLDVIYCNKDITIEEFLGYLMDCEILFTDSYHGLCFGLIFEKNIYCYKNCIRGNSRFESLKQILFLPKDFFVDDLNVAIQARREIDYTIIRKTLAQEIEKGKKWILDSLSHPAKVSWRRQFLYKMSPNSIVSMLKDYFDRFVNA